MDAALATKGLHLVWSVLEDAPLFGEDWDDGDTVRASLETKNWTWKLTWSTDSSFRGADERLPLFVELMRGKSVDETRFRTIHCRAAEIQNRVVGSQRGYDRS